MKNTNNSIMNMQRRELVIAVDNGLLPMCPYDTICTS